MLYGFARHPPLPHSRVNKVYDERRGFPLIKARRCTSPNRYPVVEGEGASFHLGSVFQDISSRYEKILIVF